MILMPQIFYVTANENAGYKCNEFNRAEAPISIIACPHRDRVIINRESYSVTFLTDQSACSLQHRESWLSAVWWSLSVVAECPVHIVVFI